MTVFILRRCPGPSVSDSNVQIAIITQQPATVGQVYTAHPDSLFTTSDTNNVVPADPLATATSTAITHDTATSATTTNDNGYDSKNGNGTSFRVSLACQEALGSQTGLPSCRDVIAGNVASPGRCEIRDQVDRFVLMGYFVLTGSLRVCVEQLNSPLSGVVCHGPLTRYIKLRVAHAPGMPGTFSRHRLQRKSAN